MRCTCSVGVRKLNKLVLVPNLPREDAAERFLQVEGIAFSKLYPQMNLALWKKVINCLCVQTKLGLGENHKGSDNCSVAKNKF